MFLSFAVFPCHKLLYQTQSTLKIYKSNYFQSKVVARQIRVNRINLENSKQNMVSLFPEMVVL